MRVDDPDPRSTCLVPRQSQNEHKPGDALLGDEHPIDDVLKVGGPPPNGKERLPSALWLMFLSWHDVKSLCSISCPPEVDKSIMPVTQRSGKSIEHGASKTSIESGTATASEIPQEAVLSWHLSPLNIFLFLSAFRILNALSIKTFFQPDEYFQSLEPAWQIAFGPDSGAWITWVSEA